MYEKEKAGFVGNHVDLLSELCSDFLNSFTLGLRYNQPHVDDEQELKDYKDDENIGTSGELDWRES